MALTQIFLDRQARSRVFSFGTTSATEEGLVTINRGTQATSYVSFINRGSAQIDGNLVVAGDITVTGAIDTQTVTNTNVKDKTITVNDGGTTAGAVGSGLIVEGDTGSVVGQIAFDNSVASKFKMGNGTTNFDVVTTEHTQTVINKSINASNNTISDTSATTGDLFKFDGTRFVRFAKGTGLQQLRVNSGGTDLEYFTPATVKEFRAVTLTGTQDGTNKVFTLSSAVTSNSEQIFYNGQLLNPGASNDYVVSATTLTFQAAFAAPLSTDTLRVYGSY